MHESTLIVSCSDLRILMYFLERTTFVSVGTNSENGSETAQYSWAGEIPQGPTFNPAKSGSPDQAKSHSQKAERSYVDVVRGNRSTHSIELIN